MGRPPCCDKSKVRKGLWTAEEDAKILAYVSTHGVGNWTLIPKKAGLNRCGKSCRLRWTNYLRPDLKHDSFSPQEEELIIECHKAIGSRWSLIAKRLKGRTDNDVKNYWNTKLKKKLIKMGIDPVTHKPVTQVLSDFGSISRIGKSLNPNRSFGKIVKNTSFPKPESSDPAAEMIINPVFDLTQETNFSSFATNLSPDFQNQCLVTNRSQFLFNEFPFSCSSSLFSSANTPQKDSSPLSQALTPGNSFCWSEFLVLDPVLGSDFQKQEQLDLQVMLPSASSSSAVTPKETAKNDFNNDKEQNSCKSSFVDEILDRDSEIQSQFPQLLDSYFYY